jgi:hypothetical protein
METEYWTTWDAFIADDLAEAWSLLATSEGEDADFLHARICENEAILDRLATRLACGRRAPETSVIVMERPRSRSLRPNAMRATTERIGGACEGDQQ